MSECKKDIKVDCYFLSSKSKLIKWIVGGALTFLLAVCSVVYAAGGSNETIRNNKREIGRVHTCIDDKIVPALIKASEERKAIAIDIAKLQTTLKTHMKKNYSRPVFDGDWAGWAMVKQNTEIKPTATPKN